MCAFKNRVGNPGDVHTGHTRTNVLTIVRKGVLVHVF